MIERMTPSEIEPALDLVADLGMELIATQKKLKIATEALERFVEWDDEYDVLPTELERSATQALARIKEV